METKKEKVALILNLVIVGLVIIGSIMCFAEIYIVETKPIEHGFKLFKFFTVQSNVFAGITALVYLIYLFRKKKTGKGIPAFVQILRYVATIDLVITFLVVALFLGFIVDEGYFSLYVNANFFYHFAVPVLNLVSFLFFETKPKFKFSYTFVGLIHLILYSIFYLIVVLTHIENGAVDLYYDWYAFGQFGIIWAFVSAIVVFGLGYLTAFVLYKLVNKRAK